MSILEKFASRIGVFVTVYCCCQMFTPGMSFRRDMHITAIAAIATATVSLLMREFRRGDNE
jgi:hypothetical protein